MSSKDPTLIDGYSSVQAIRRTAKAPDAPRLRHSATRLPDAPAAAPESPPVPAATRIGHTAVPAKRDLVCYECQYAFTVTGKIHYTFCPKCKRNLNMNDESIGGAWTGDLKTMGTITVEAGAVLRGAALTAQNLIVAGDVTGATLRVHRRLEVAAGALLDWRTITFRDLTVQAGAALAFAEPLTVRTLDLAGALQAAVRAEARAIIRATGDFRGELEAPTLLVEEGAALHAALRIGALRQADQAPARNAA